MRIQKLFIYGTLREGEIRKAFFGGYGAGTPDSLEGYARGTTDIRGILYPNVYMKEGTSVEGEVMDVSEETLRHTDSYETDAYKRQMLTLKSGTQAWVYVRE